MRKANTARIVTAINLNLTASLGLALWLFGLCVTSYSQTTPGQLNSLTSQAGNATNYAYDTASRLWKITDAKQGVTEFGYNARSQRIAVTDAKAQPYSFSYDAMGRVLTAARGGLTMSYSYTNGVRTSRTDYNGAVTSYSYDALNRLTTLSYPGGGTAAYTYDEVSNLKTATNINGTVTLNYDARNRVSSVTDVWGQAITYAYDASNNRTQLALPNYQVSYSYDAANRLTQVNHTQVGAATFGYDAVNRLRTRALPNGVTATANYDDLDRLSSLSYTKAAATLASYQYSYNTVNQITQMVEAAGTHSFGYDELQRLTSAVHPTQVPELYSYDAVGNRTASQQAALYSYQTPNRVTQIGSTTYSYDNNGNLKTKTEALALTTQYFYDHENRLTSVMLPSTVVINYKYDALGRRVERSRSGGTWQRYSYDGLEVVRDSNSDGSSVEYVNGGELDDHLWQRASGGATHYFLTDHQGSTRVLADASGAVAASYSYDTFGNGFSSSLTRFGYTGREHDSETGLLYYRARWYDPGQGRFVSEDPIGFDGGINLYAYVDNDSFNRIDPTGEKPWGLIFGVADLALQLYRNGGNWRCLNWTELGLSVLAGGALNAAGKGAFRFKTKGPHPSDKGSHTWDVTRRWMDKKDIQMPGAGQQRHHWFFERNQGLGKYLPDWIKNQPWNTNPISAGFNNWLGRHPWLAWLGGPSWAGEVAAGAGMALGGSKGCGESQGCGESKGCERAR